VAHIIQRVGFKPKGNYLYELGIYFTLVAIGFVIYHQYGYVSQVFAPFNYESILFYKNYDTFTSFNSLFTRDWSTYPTEDGHPLYYFHNLDLVHLLNGYVLQEFSKPTSYILQISIATAFYYLAFRFLYQLLENLYPAQLERISFALLILASVVFLIYPIRNVLGGLDNILLASTFFLSVANFKFLITNYDISRLTVRNTFEVLSYILFAALCETNLALLLILITSFYYSADLIGNFRRDNALKTLALVVLAFAILLLPRSIQLIQIFWKGNYHIYSSDIKLTSLLKQGAGIQVADAVDRYQSLGLVYFGDPSTPSVYQNFKQLLIFFHALTYKGVLFLPLVYGYIKGIGSKQIKVKIYSRYVISYCVAVFLVVLITGDSILKISLSRSGFLTYYATLVLALLYICFLILNNQPFSALYKKCVGLFLLVLALVVTYEIARELPGHRDHSNFLKFQRKLEKDSIVISNYEPSIVHSLFGSPVAISWFVDEANPSMISKSPLLLKFWNVPKVGCLKVPTYFFLAKFEPYSNADLNITLKLNALFGDSKEYQLIQDDKYFAMYRYTNVMNFGCHS